VTPDQINAEHGKASWRCWGCKAESGLHWWNGLSVAVCNKPECSKAYSDFLAAEVAAQEALEAHAREYWPY
jgi:hypothetical protein